MSGRFPASAVNPGQVLPPGPSEASGRSRLEYSTRPVAAQPRSEADLEKCSVTKRTPGSRQKIQTDTPTMATDHSTDQRRPALFPVVGIGASAGGLAALESFFRGVPAQSGMAFVVVQHLAPAHRSTLPELLQRVTSMQVMAAAEGTPLEPDCVYVTPPNWELSITNGVLHLLEPARMRGLRMPIDRFLRALAEDRGEYAVGVILSGMGSDGTLGIRAIRALAGLTLAQDPSSAEFGSMPLSAIDIGQADVVAPPSELAVKILQTMRHGVAAPLPIARAHQQENDLDRIVILLRARTGQDFSLYKKNTLARRIERRMHLHQLDTVSDYARFLVENSQELDLLFKELLIGVTNFFRDPPAWAILQREVLPTLLSECPDGKVLRAWVVGCSTGEEAYSLAMSFREAMDAVRRTGSVALQIFATDLDADAIDRARQGLYPLNIAADVSPERLARFFTEEDAGYRVRKEIREMVVFAPHNVAMDPPFTRLDILTCRNLLIYFGPELQAKLMPLFHFSLNPDGVLFLGSAEAIGRFTDLFLPIDSQMRLFRRAGGLQRSAALDFPNKKPPAMPGTATPPAGPPAANLQTLADQFLLQRYAPAAVLVNADGDILYVSGRTGRYLEPAAGKANWNIYAMAREGLRHELMISLPRAIRDGEPVIRRGVRVDSDGATRLLDLTVHRFDEPAALRGTAMVVFSETPASLMPAEPPPVMTGPGASDKRVTELETALQRAHEELKAARDYMQMREEELRATTEEYQSTNEELQSTNEELTTSKEEMQSLNEELQTLNAELQSKVEELSLANNDMKNLLNSIDVAIVFLDNSLRVRRFTRPLTRIFKLIPSDVGRPLSDVATGLDYPELEEDMHEVLRTLVFSEKQAPTQDGRWLQVRIMPYRTAENVIDGLVTTFTDITAVREMSSPVSQ